MIFMSGTVDADGIKSVPKLREITGADALVSPKAFVPVSEALVKRHLSENGVLYRIMTSKDMKDSDPGGLLANLSKMQSVGAKPWQSVLLFESNNTILEYDHYLAKMDAWVQHGGITVDTLGRDYRHYLTWREQHPISDDVSKLYPKWRGKQLEMVKDWRWTIATFPGVGPKGADAIQKILIERNLGDSLLQAISFITDTNELKSSEGNWKRVRELARDWLGLPEGFDIDIKFIGDEEK